MTLYIQHTDGHITTHEGITLMQAAELCAMSTVKWWWWA